MEWCFDTAEQTIYECKKIDLIVREESSKENSGLKHNYLVNLIIGNCNITCEHLSIDYPELQFL